MKLDPFRLERWLLNSAEIDLGGGGVQKLALSDIVKEFPEKHLMKYGRTDGSPILKELVADWYGDIDHDRILITSGTSEANLLINYTLLEAGDHYLTENPQYEQTTGLARSLGVKVEEFQLYEDNRWRPSVEEIKEKATRKTKIIFLDNPNNPTGSMLQKSEMKSICEVAEDIGAYVHCDNALRGSELTGKPAETPLEFTDRAIVSGSISKLGATSPRIGWIIGDKKIIERCWIAKDYTTLGHSALGEYIAEKILSKRVEIIQRNLKINNMNLSTLESWVRLNLDLVSLEKPVAGFTGFPRYSIDEKSENLCKELLAHKGVLMSPGRFFGSENHLRINTGVDNKIMVEGLNRLSDYLRNIA